LLSPGVSRLRGNVTTGSFVLPSGSQPKDTFGSALVQKTRWIILCRLVANRIRLSRGGFPASPELISLKSSSSYPFSAWSSQLNRKNPPPASHELVITERFVHWVSVFVRSVNTSPPSETGFGSGLYSSNQSGSFPPRDGIHSLKRRRPRAPSACCTLNASGVGRHSDQKLFAPGPSGTRPR